MDAIWGDEPTDAARNSLQSQNLPPARAPRSVRRPAGAARRRVPAAARARRARRGPRALRSRRRRGRGRRRSERRRRPPAPVLGAWRGIPLDEFVEVAPLAAEAVALAELRATVVDECSELLVASRTAGRRDRAGVAGGRRCAAARAQPARADAGAGRCGPGPRRAPPRHGVPRHGWPRRPGSTRHRRSRALEQAVAAGDLAVAAPARPAAAPPGGARADRRPARGEGWPDPRPGGRAGASWRSSSPSERLVTCSDRAGWARPGWRPSWPGSTRAPPGSRRWPSSTIRRRSCPPSPPASGLRTAPGDEMHEACVARLSAGEVAPRPRQLRARAGRGPGHGGRPAGPMPAS